MCNPTSAPPRRDLYELEQTIRAEKQETAEPTPEPTGSFSLPKPRPPRINTYEWDSARPGVYGVYNAARLPSGHIIPLRNPWTVIGPATFRCFHTHHEALTYATTKAASK